MVDCGVAADISWLVGGWLVGGSGRLNRYK